MASLQQWKPKEHHEQFKRQLLTLLKDARDQPERGAVGEQLVEMADRALDLYLTNRTERGIFRALNWVLPGLSAIAAAVGGSVLTAGNLSGPVRWIVGGTSLVGGITGGLVSVLKPPEELAIHQRWVRLYEALWREIWHYALTQFQSSDLVAAGKQMNRFGSRFTEIAALIEPTAPDSTKEPGTK